MSALRAKCLKAYVYCEHFASLQIAIDPWDCRTPFRHALGMGRDLSSPLKGGESN